MGYIKRMMPILITLGLLQHGPNKHSAEFFAGEAQVSENLSQMGYTTQRFDLRYTKAHNVLTAVGFYVLLSAVYTTCLGGIVWLAPPCSSWVFLSRYSTGRHLGVLGHEYIENVRAQNALVARITYAVVLCIKRGVHWVIEQPISSVLWDHPRMQAVLEKYADRIDTAVVQMGAYNLEAEKTLKLVGDWGEGEEG
jgi:hypothetical protein